MACLKHTIGGHMFTALLLLSAISGQPAIPGARAHLDGDRPRISLWTDQGDAPYRTGGIARVFVRPDRDAYVTIFRIDTDGRVRVLFPRDPWEDDFVRGGREFEVEATRDGDAFYIDDYAGVGYVFAVSSPTPFDYDAITSGDRWDYRVVADGRIRGDPYVALTDLAQRIVPDGDNDWDYDLVPYYVERHYDYPRFLCYDCHSYASYSAWDPYAYSCVRFRIVVYDDPYYYPYRYYGGTRVVFSRPLRPEPRFIFKDRDGVSDERFVTHVRERERPVNDNGRRGVRGADLGGRSIPVPDNRRRPSDDPRRRIGDPGSRDQDRPGSDRPDWRGRPPERRDDQPDWRGRPPERRDDQPDGSGHVPERRDDRPGWRGRSPERRDDGPTARPDQSRDDRRDRPVPPSQPAPDRRPDDRQGGGRDGRVRDNPSPPRQGDDARRAPPPQSRGRDAAPPKKDDSSKPELRRRRP